MLQRHRWRRQKFWTSNSRFPGCSGQASDAVSADTQFKMKDAPEILHHLEEGLSKDLDQIATNKKTVTWDSIDDPFELLERNHHGHPTAGLSEETNVEQILMEEGWEKIQDGTVYTSSKIAVMLVGVCRRHFDDTIHSEHTDGKGKKLKENVDLDDPTSFTDQSTSLMTLEWKQTSITSCTVFSNFSATLTTFWKLLKITSARGSKVTAFHQWHLAGRNRSNRTPMSGCKRRNNIRWPHDWSKFAPLSGCSLLWSSCYRPENHPRHSPSQSHTSMNLTGDRAFISSAPAKRRRARSPASAAFAASSVAFKETTNGGCGAVFAPRGGPHRGPSRWNQLTNIALYGVTLDRTIGDPIGKVWPRPALRSSRTQRLFGVVSWMKICDKCVARVMCFSAHQKLDCFHQSTLPQQQQ